MGKVTTITRYSKGRVLDGVSVPMFECPSVGVL